MSTDNQGKNYVVVSSKSWSYKIFCDVIRNNQGKWHFIQSPEDLNIGTIRKINPHYIFFLHWSWKVSNELIKNYECVCFHMTEVPYGRGGSPLQNLIIRGHQTTKITALKMIEELDAGPIYCQENLSLAGNAEEIYIRATHLSAKMIEYIVKKEPKPLEQSGEITLFKRRKPSESEIVEVKSFQQLYDFIRMLDAEGYPHAFFQYMGFQYSFRRAAIYDGRIVADVTITPIEDPKT